MSNDPLPRNPDGVVDDDHDDAYYHNLMQKGQPCRTARETQRALSLLLGEAPQPSAAVSGTDSASRPPPPRPPLYNVFGSGPILLSHIPSSCRRSSGGNGGVIMGIDEAGRGSVCGPMVYGAAYWHSSSSSAAKKGTLWADLQDSKKLTDVTRRHLFRRLQSEAPYAEQVGWAVRVIPASEISRLMSRTDRVNLNAMSHGAAQTLVRQVMQQGGVHIQTCYVDTVGPPEAYRRWLQQEFPTIDFVVEAKADANYPTCSAASIVAKVVRDSILENWQFSEPALNLPTLIQQPKEYKEDVTTMIPRMSREMGSGYPSDPVCQAWMDQALQCPIFGFPDVVRFTWAPIVKALDQKAVAVRFAADINDEEDGHGQGKALELRSKRRQQERMGAFLGLSTPRKAKKVKRMPYFEQQGLHVVTEL